MNEPKIQSLILATEVSVECPQCTSMQYGFIGNPAGGQFDCDDCGERYKVHPEADIEHR